VVWPALHWMQETADNAIFEYLNGPGWKRMPFND
jgi:hypothetical protein